jgi:O-antigen/teichoic acid export membrane protein
MLKSIVKGAGILTFGFVISRIFMFMFRYICMVSLSVDEYGKLALLISSFNALIIFAHFNFGTAVLKYWSEKKESVDEKSKIYQNSIFLSFITSIISFLILYFIWSQYIEFSIKLFFVLAVSVICFAIFTINWGFFIGNFKMEYSSLTYSLLGFSRVILVAVFLFVFGLKTLGSYLYAFVLGGITPFIISIIILKKKFRFLRILPRKIDIHSFKKIISYSVFIMIVGLMFSLMDFYVRWHLSFYSYEDTALYDGAFLLYIIIQMFMSNYVMSLVPYVSKRMSENKNILVISIWDFIILLIVVFTISIFLNYTKIDDSLLFLLNLESYIPSLRIFSVLLITIPFHLYFAAYHGILQGAGKTKDLAIIVSIAALCYIVVTPLFVKFLGVLGAAVSYIFMYIILDIVSFRRITRLNIPIRSVFLSQRFVNYFKKNETFKS